MSGLRASRHRCVLRISTTCTHGNGKPKRKRCAHCGGLLLVETGLWYVFAWRGDGRYRAAYAESAHVHEATARRAAERDPDRLVWRFLSD